MNALRPFLAVWAIAMLAAAVPAAGQPPADALPDNAIMFGPLAVTPTLVVRDAGVDNNVFNEDVDPKSDFTFTLTPAATLGLRVRRLRTSVNLATDYVYFRKYSSERGLNFNSGARADLDLGTLQPYVAVTALSTRNRMSPELDVRARHRDFGILTGTAVRMSPTTQFLFNARRTTVSFDPDAQFRGVPLEQSFDGPRTALDGAIAVELTPVTTVSFVAAREKQTFDLAPDRNSTSWRIGPSVSFNPLGLITGGASMSFRHFTTLSPDLPNFSGLVASVSIGATIYGRHQLQTLFSRDVQYSYDLETPYYLATGGSVTWTSLVAGPIDVRGTVGRQHLGYRSTIGEAGDDRVVSYGGGLGYRFSDRARLGINIEHADRFSNRSAIRDFRNNRIFASLSWGIVQ